MLLRKKVPALCSAAVMLASVAVVALFASAALAQTSSGSASATASTTSSVTATAGSTAAVTISAAASVSPSATATASATASASALSKTGGPPYILPVTLAASLALVLFGLVALRLAMARGTSRAPVRASWKRRKTDE